VSDVDLVARARQGDPAAFGELVERHRMAVYRAALAALGSHADAEDAAQDAFLVAFRRLDTFRGDSSFKTWLLTIAWHQAINHRRSLGRVWRRMVAPKDQEEMESVLENVAAAGPTPEGATVHRRAAPGTRAGHSRALTQAARRAAARAVRRIQLRRDRDHAWRAARHHQMARVRSAARGTSEAAAARLRRCPMNGWIA
jgi:RNA polymerase sigma factor (sigma-70 family)